ncbi:protein phosphatase CheZ [Aestuariibacter halophilus]|uniref:Protein phosphatase CheZ n=1 Tax=Fluctibacter halophilus TaxID=226011 RepID=A0ABS8G531_9ALTE|nr:protein phosphatase CheZ [Aestuariibacter halophilus]MCC2614769.1 protein phosphatase CheZ [Aestuariibacter halophilus]
MSSSEQPTISLEDARQLVSLLEAGDVKAANELVEAHTINDSVELFAEVGKLTRQLHDSLNSFQLDGRIADLATSDIPDAQSRLAYVIETTEQAANTTMDAVETSMPIAEKINERMAGILPEWKKLMNRQMELGEFKTLCYDLDALLEDSSKESAKLAELLTEVLMAQGYQDLTGQVIRRVIELVKEVEDSLVHMLTMFGEPEMNEKSKKKDDQTDNVKAEGPIIDADSRDDVVSGQDDVDDLLSSLGF